ncbi:FAD binding domain-containing protein [Pochonia chlamydosporia 170]|uniref:FAD binding domain-containing protein n=1 Tax=Pochonia chlamydosporia 170 TaxID=1380566 RepID=A0A179FY65_METCM|nr:FAD binding domain-containing protein [Pochonia chlamydosporia 170]OAQ70616.1 FAD binding domain-containing protein [Pochonia chlamydosporia 170]
MRLFGLSTVLLAQLGLSAATLTLSEVQAQIEAYQEQNGTNVARSAPQFGCTLACGFLAFSNSGKLSYPNSPTYEFEESRYWSQQQALTHPACRFTPGSAEDVSLAVLTSRVTQCKFAVKSGGHAAFAGASNIEGGVTLDLRKLNQIVVSADKKQTAVGAGNVWYDVYTKLQPMGLTVIGGRVSAIGVGGLTLGGGISFFSNRYGWACDNVNNYQVVFADGTIRDVNPKSYSDLYWALRGGGNNFGIVTRFDLATYPQGDMWAGAQTFLLNKDTTAAVNNAFYNFAINSPQDPYAQIITAYAYAQTQNIYVIASDLQYGKPTPNPAILKNFTDIPGPIADTLRVTNLTGLTLEFNNTNPGGFRQTYWALMTGNDAALMTEMVSIYQEEVEKVKDAPGIVPSVIFQPISTDQTKFFSKNGGNPLGLAGQGPLNLINIDISWSNVADDTRILAAAQNMATRFAAAAKAKGLDHPYLYQNYAALQQDVFSSYGKDNVARLKSVQAKYDPTKVWQKLQPGYFKLG